MLYDIVMYDILLYDIAYYNCIFLIYELVSHDNVLEYDTMLCYNIASCDIESSDIVLYEFVLVYNKIQCFYFILLYYLIPHHKMIMNILYEMIR